MAVFAGLRGRLTRWRKRSEADSKQGARRIWYWGIGATFGLYALYVAVATAFVCWGGMTWVTQTEDDVRIDVKSGYSLFPGRMHLKGLSVQFKDYNVEMAMSADEADLSIALHRLPAKQIHVHWVRASGVEFKMLHRVRDAQKSAARLAAFPDITAFQRPPYYDAPRPPRSGKKLWSLRVDSIEAEARFAWIMEYQLRGKMSAKGAFYTDPLHEAEVLPCEVQVSEGTMSVGREQIAHNVQGSLAFALAPFKVRNAPLKEVIPKISARVGEFSAEVDTLSFSKLYFPMDSLALDGQGQLKVDTTVIKGQMQPGSRVSLGLDPLTVAAQAEGKENVAQSARGRGELSMSVEQGGHVGVAALVFVPPERGAAFSVEKLEARAALQHRDITEVKVRGVQVDVKTLHCAHPEFLHALLGHNAAIPMSGTFHLQAKADMPERGSAQLDANLKMHSVSFYVEGHSMGVTSETKVSCRGALEEADCSVDFHAPYLRFDVQSDGEAEDLWLRLKTRKTLRVSAEQGTFEGGFLISGGDPQDVVSEWIGEAWLPQLGLKLLPTGPITGTFNAKRTKQEFSLSEIDIATGKTQWEGQLTSGKVTSALGTLKMPLGRWGFEVTPAGVKIKPFIGKHWIEKQ